MASSVPQQVESIIGDESLSKSAKIEKLKTLEREARDLQRAASESGMDPGDGSNRDLRSIELALRKLHADTPETGAATL
ncbi:MAG: hypothetical protein ACRECW_19540 [Phyllobacterium sp.]